MTIEEKNKAIRTYLIEKGFRPRDDKDLKKYITQLNTRLGKQGKHLYIYETNDEIKVSIEDKKPIIPKNHAMYSRATNEEFEKYNALAKSKNTTLSKLIHELLEKEYQNARTNNNI